MLSLYRLPEMMPGEKVIRIVRRGQFVFFQRLLLLFFLAAAPLALAYGAVYTYPALLDEPVLFSVLVLAGSGYYLFIWLFSFFNFIDFYLNVFAITNERIIDIKQEGFFARTISEQRIEKVQDVTSEVEGILATVFRYGNIYVQTAGEQEKFYFKNISHPDDVRDLVIKLAEDKRGSNKD